MAVLGWGGYIEAQTIVPRLVVNVSINQLRGDYLELFSDRYGENGFKRLLNQGLVYENATYPFSMPDRASGVATLVSGTTPFYHGIVGRQWFDKGSLRPIRCTEDPLHPETPSPTQLMVSTLGDELKIATQNGARVMSIAPYPEMAVMAAGHAADYVCWMEERTGLWTTSQFYSNNTPNYILTLNEIRKVNKEHKKKPRPSAAEVTELALQAITYEGMGVDNVTDILFLGYDASLPNNQNVSDCQQVMADIYQQLDRSIGEVITRLERRIGKDQVLFVVTSTGENAYEAPDYTTYRIPTGDFYINRAANLLNMYLGALWGQGRYIEGGYDNQLYTNHKLLETRKLSLSEFYQRAEEFLSQMAGVKSIYTGLQLRSDHSESIKNLRNGYVPGKSGDILIEVAPGWQIQHEETGAKRLSTAVTMPFPIILMGCGMPAERITQLVTTDHIAPTISKAIHIRAPNACANQGLIIDSTK